MKAKLINIFIIIFCLSVVSCTEINPFDIGYPVPKITSITENPKVGDEITIKGSGFTAPNAVSLDGITMKITSEKDNEIKAILPRIFKSAVLKLTNVYKLSAQESFTINPIYPTIDEIQVTQWPAKITRGRAIVIKGENVDLITDVTVGGNKFTINGLTQSPGMITVLAPESLEGPVKIVCTTMYGNTLESNPLDVVDPSKIFKPVDPITLFDFEDGNTYFVSGDLPASKYTAQINRSGIIPARGQKYFSFYSDEVNSNWTYLGSIKKKFDTPLDLSEFNDPYISFLVNSADNVCNFQVAVTQDGKVGGSYFANGVTGNPLDAWMLRPTNGQWQWVSARLSDLLTENWGGGFTKFNPQGKIDAIELVIKQVNAGYWDGTTSAGGKFVNPKFRMNLDQVMITDGPVKPTYLLNDFESSKSNFVDAPSDGQTADVNKIANSYVAPISGNNYFSVIKNNCAGWKWLGTLEFNGNYDLATLNDPYLCFLANTNGQKANLQFELVQGGVVYGSSINTAQWFFTTNGWEMQKLQLKSMQWDNWSGTGTKIDFNKPFEKIVIGFSSGNVSGTTYELHMDDIMISDGAMF